jgi:FixJ family two-component response regulator
MACLILDVMMPGISGIALHRQLAEKGSDLPIIFLTGHGDLPMGVQAIKRGAEDFLQKLVDESILLDVASKALSQYQSISNEQLENNKLVSVLDTMTPLDLEILRLIFWVWRRTGTLPVFFIFLKLR